MTSCEAFITTTKMHMINKMASNLVKILVLLSLYLRALLISFMRLLMHLLTFKY